jgi:hypothetical protein
MIETKGRKISQDRGGYCWCLIPQWYECMLMHIGIPSWCSIQCLFIRVRLWVVVVATLPWLELAWYIWVTNRWYEYGAKFQWTQHCLPWKQELTPSCDLEVYMKQFICIWIPTKRAGLLTHMVYLNCCNHLWVSLSTEIGIEHHVWKRMKRSWPACKQSRFILMWLHHMLWCGVIGEEYDGFVTNSNLYLLTQQWCGKLMVFF